MILDAMKSAILRLTGTEVGEVFASSDQICVEISDLVNDVATDIARSHDWQALTKVAEVVGTSATEYELPSDYDRMPVGSDIDDKTNWFWGYFPFDNVNEWLRYKTGQYSIITPGGWIILGNKLNFYPAPNGTAQYPYISNRWALDEEGGAKGEFTSDSDIFLLDERLLTLGLIWRWQAQKDMAYAESMETFEIALSRAQARDKGSRVIRSSRTAPNLNARLAYPWSLGS